MKTKISIVFLGLGLLFSLGCTKYPPSSERLLEDLAVVTRYDTKVDFNNYKTYAITDHIEKITDKDSTQMTNSAAMTVLAQIDKNMQARGFTKVDKDANPDFGIDVLYFQNTTVYAYYGSYWGYYYPYYYPYYPVYYSSYTTGMADIELVDLKNISPTDTKIYLRWNAYIRGLMTDTHTSADLTGAVDQAFIQTPQLKTTAK
jgi:hypothetical protein